jgi:ribosomal protein L7Ae-like RNA K-turn-binding protein
MRSDDVFSLLGIAQKARKLISGQDSVERGINAKKVFLIIVSKDTSKNTSKKITNLSARKDIPMSLWGRSDELGKAIGKKQRKVIGITDKGIAKEIYRRINLLTGVGDIDETTRI